MLEAMVLQAHVVSVATEDVRIVPEIVRKAVVEALKEMSLKPRSDMKQAARILGVHYEGIRKAIESGRPGPGIRDRVIEYLAQRGALRNATVEDLLDRFGPADQREQWTWRKLLDLPDPYPARRPAKMWASKNAIPLEVAVRICTRPPWTSASFAHRDTAWWTEEMKREAADSPPEVPAERIAEMVAEDYRVLMAG